MVQEWYRPKEAAEYSRVSERTLKEWLKSGLKHSKINSAVLIKREWIDEYIERHIVTENQVDAIAAEVMAGF